MGHVGSEAESSTRYPSYILLRSPGTKPGLRAGKVTPADRSLADTTSGSHRC